MQSLIKHVWTRAELASRINLVAFGLAGTILLLTLAVSAGTSYMLLSTHLAFTLETEAAEAQARFESALEDLLQRVEAISSQTIISNALVDSASHSISILPHLREICSIEPHVINLKLSDYQGTTLVEGCHPTEQPSYTPTHDLLQNAVTAGRSISYLEVSDDLIHLQVASPVTFLPTGSYEGAIGAEIDLQSLFGALGTSQAPGRQKRLVPLLASAAAEITESDGALRLLVPVALRLTGNHPLGIEIAIPTRIAYRPIYLLLLAHALLGTALLIASQAISRRLAQRIGRPLNELKETAEHVAAGRFDKLPEARTVADDADSFSKLAASVYHMIDTLQASQRSLEQMLARRTAEVERSEALLLLKERALQAVSSGIVITDLSREDNPVVYVNKAFEQNTGYCTEEILGHNCRILRGSDHEQEALPVLRAAIDARKSCRVVLRNYRKDGAMFWNELFISPVASGADGEVTHFIGVQNDITERKQTDDLLIEWLSRLDVIFTLSPDSLVCFDHHEHLSYMNPAAERALNSSFRTLEGMSFSAFYAHLRSLSDPALPFPSPPPGRTEGSGSAPCAQEDELIYLSQPRPLVLKQSYRYCSSESASLVLYFRDVTREAEVDRMKSDFLSIAAHELRSPMTSIMGFSELLLMRRFDEKRTHEMLTSINRQSQRLTNLLGELLDLARIEARRGKDFKLKLLSLHGLVQEVLSAFMMPNDPRAIDARIETDDLMLHVDRDKFHQALVNVLSNAYKYSPPGSSVELTVIERKEQNRAEAGIVVRDHGIGMSPEEAARAFERFYRADSSCHIPGTGLGLPLVKEIVELHGGSVRLDSQPGIGTSVTLWFPLAQAGDSEHSRATAKAGRT